MKELDIQKLQDIKRIKQNLTEIRYAIDGTEQLLDNITPTGIENYFEDKPVSCPICKYWEDQFKKQ